MPFRVSVGGFFRKRGFGRPLAAFVFSIAVTNVVGAFIEEVSFFARVACSFGQHPGRAGCYRASLFFARGGWLSGARGGGRERENTTVKITRDATAI